MIYIIWPIYPAGRVTYRVICFNSFASSSPVWLTTIFHFHPSFLPIIRIFHHLPPSHPITSLRAAAVKSRQKSFVRAHANRLSDTPALAFFTTTAASLPRAAIALRLHQHHSQHPLHLLQNHEHLPAIIIHSPAARRSCCCNGPC